MAVRGGGGNDWLLGKHMPRGDNVLAIEVITADGEDSA
jgi:hypothetical protein